MNRQWWAGQGNRQGNNKDNNDDGEGWHDGQVHLPSYSFFINDPHHNALPPAPSTPATQ